VASANRGVLVGFKDAVEDDEFEELLSLVTKLERFFSSNVDIVII
jgi:hypothetical protein